MAPPSRSASMWRSVGSYRRIQILEKDDIEALFPLVAAYIKQPSLADSVKELVIDCKSWPTCGPIWLDPNHLSFPVDEDVHIAIGVYVRGLGLGDETVSTLLSALDWKKQQLAGGTPGTPGTYSRQNFAFATAASVVLLSLCKNITRLYLGRVGRSALGEYLLKSNYGLIPQPVLQKLQSVEFIAGGDIMDDERYYDTVEFLDDFRYFHRLPVITSVTMDGVAEYQSARDLFVPQTSNIRKIHIGHADMPSSLIGTIIRIPKRLEEFSLSLGGLWSIDGGHSEVFTKTVGKCLLEQKETLRVLDLDIDGDLLDYDPNLPGSTYGRNYEKEDGTHEEDIEQYDGDVREMYKNVDEYFRLDRQISGSSLWTTGLPDTRKYGYTIGSLHDFTALTRLSIGICALMGYRRTGKPPRCLAEQPPFRLIDALPPSLEYLCLYGYTKGEVPDVDEHVDELMEKRAERLPLLKEVRGVDEMVEDVATAFPNAEFSNDEDALWEKTYRRLDWIEA